MNFCRDCKHYRRNDYAYGVSWPATCWHPQLMSPANPVTGSEEPADPHAERASLLDESCGPDGALFEAKPAPAPKPRRQWRWWLV